jgi:DNA-binding LacI/PurR family transcriptional regulator
VEERFDHTPEAGADAARSLLDRYPDLTALACTTDVLALGALAEVRRRGLSVPEDLSITGFDDVNEARAAGLTTVRQPMVEKGRTAGRLLLDRGERSEPRVVRLPTELVVRASTAAPRTDRVQLP